MAVSRKIRCLVSEINASGDHVYTIELIPEKNLPRFKPGQFLHLCLDEYDPSQFWPESRIFSIASSPDNQNIIRIAYSVKGKYTTRMENELHVGKHVWIKLPYGDFIIDDKYNTVLIAGGTGITAFTAFLNSLKCETNRNIYLFYGVKNKNLFLYKDMLTNKNAAIPNLTVKYFIENHDSKLFIDEISGFISIDKIWNQIKEPMNSVYYISGPPVMLKTISDDLKLRGVDDASIRIDAW
jgi:ferredoxin-NADP reductase